MNHRLNVLAAAIAALLVAPLPCAASQAGAPAAATPAAPANSMTIPALGLSYQGQYLAWITAHDGKTELMLASSAGRHVHAVTIPGACAETGLRWAQKWNTLAILTQCTASTSATHAIHGALWMVDVGVGAKPTLPRKVADIPGTASDLQWRTDDKVIAFLYAPEAAAPHSIAAVVATGGMPQLTTPADWNVHEYRLLPQNGGVMYTANAGAAAQPQAPALYLQTGRVPKVLFDPATAKGALRGLRVSLPGWTNSLPSFVTFLGRRPGATSSRIYGLWPSHGGPGKWPGQLAWYRTRPGAPIISTALVNGMVRVSDGLYAFTVPGAIHAGRMPFSVALPSTNDFPNGAWGAHATGGNGYAGASVAFVQTLPGRPPVIRAGRFSTKAPPIVWSAGTMQVAMASH